jgi:hypothetical protein
VIRLPQSGAWGKLQEVLIEHGYLNHDEFRDIQSYSDISPALEAAISLASVNLDSGEESNPGLNQIHDNEKLSQIINYYDGLFCGRTEQNGGMHVLSFGPPRGRWEKSDLTVFIDMTGCNYAPSSYIYNKVYRA